MEFKDNKPIYLQIADRICDEILAGKYKEEERVPSVREYAAIVEVNANTAMRSFDHLQSHEVIFNKRGLGYFVSKGAMGRIKKIRETLFLKEEIHYFFTQIDTLGIPFEEIEKMYHTYKNSRP